MFKILHSNHYVFPNLYKFSSQVQRNFKTLFLRDRHITIQFSFLFVGAWYLTSIFINLGGTEYTMSPLTQTLGGTCPPRPPPNYAHGGMY